MSHPSRKNLQPIGNRSLRERVQIGKSNRMDTLLERTMTASSKLSQTNPNLKHSLVSTLPHYLPNLEQQQQATLKMQRSKTAPSPHNDSQRFDHIFTKTSTPWTATQLVMHNETNEQPSNYSRIIQHRCAPLQCDNEAQNGITTGNLILQNPILKRAENVKIDKILSSGSDVDTEKMNTLVHQQLIPKTRYGKTIYPETKHLFEGNAKSGLYMQEPLRLRTLNQYLRDTRRPFDADEKEQLRAREQVRLNRRRSNEQRVQTKYFQEEQEMLAARLRGKRVSGYDNLKSGTYFDPLQSLLTFHNINKTL